MPNTHTTNKCVSGSVFGEDGTKILNKNTEEQTIFCVKKRKSERKFCVCFLLLFTIEALFRMHVHVKHHYVSIETSDLRAKRKKQTDLDRQIKIACKLQHSRMMS